MRGSGTFQSNAATVILASGFSGPTDLGNLPRSVAELAMLPEPVTLVRADESVTFHLSSKSDDSVRSDTSLYRWITQVAASVVSEPDYFLTGSEINTFQLLKKVAPPAKHPQLHYVRLPIKFVPTASAASKGPELWLRTVVLHTDDSVAQYLKDGVQVGV